MDVIFDVDGTLMDLDHRRKFLDGSMGKKDWVGFVDATKDDTPKDQIHSVAKALAAQGHRIIILTGRNQAQHDIYGFFTNLLIQKRLKVFSRSPVWNCSVWIRGTLRTNILFYNSNLIFADII